MCGLVGVAGNIFTAEKEAFKWLHYFDMKRGEHSTGMAIVGDNSHDVKVLKEVGYTTKLWEKYPDEFTPTHLYKSSSCKVLLGHNRYATVGSKTADNAHPFQHGKITGAHNGTLSAYWLDKLDGYNKFEVDSEAIFYSLNKNGFEKTMGMLHGAWALVWWDENASTLNFIRNKERTLFYQWNKERKTLFWASEEWMLMAALHLAKINTGDEKIHSFTPDRLYELEFPKTSWNIDPKKFTYTQESFSGFQPPVSKSNSHSYWQEWANQQDWDGDHYFNNTTTTTNTAKKPDVASSNDVVITQNNNKELDKINADRTQANKLMDREIIFNIYGERKSGNAGTYLIASCDGLPDSYEIRLYCSQHPRFEEWRTCTHTYKGVIKGHPPGQWNYQKNRMERYLILDLRSISEPIIEEEKKPEKPNLSLAVDNTKKSEATIILPKDLEWDPKGTYLGLGDKPITFTEFMQAVNKGCICCGERITPDEKDDVLFVQKGRLLCSICSSNMENLRLYKVV